MIRFFGEIRRFEPRGCATFDEGAGIYWANLVDGGVAARFTTIDRFDESVGLVGIVGLRQFTQRRGEELEFFLRRVHDEVEAEMRAA